MPEADDVRYLPITVIKPADGCTVKRLSAAHQIARQRRQPVEIVVRKVKLDRDVLALGRPRLGKTGRSTERPFFFSGINLFEPLHALVKFAGTRPEIVGASTGDHVAVGVGVPRGAAANQCEHHADDGDDALCRSQ